MDTSASIIKAVLPDMAQKLLAGNDGGAPERPRAADAGVDRMAGNSIRAILDAAPQLRRTFGPGRGTVIILAALLANGRGQGRLLFGVSIGVLGALKYLGHF